MKALIVGATGHGKTTLAKLLKKKKLAKFNDTTKIAIEAFYDPNFIGRFDSIESVIANKEEVRGELSDLIESYCSDDKTAFAKLACKGGFGYVGMRHFDQVLACLDMFTHVIYVNRPKEDSSGLDFTFEDLYEEWLLQKNFSLAKVNNYSLDFLDRLTSDRRMKGFLDKSNTFSYFA